MIQVSMKNIAENIELVCGDEIFNYESVLRKTQETKQSA